MNIDYIRMKEKVFTIIDSPESITSMKIWHCNFKTIQSISNCINLETLSIASYPDDTFEPIMNLSKLRNLTIIHFPKVKDLTPIANLQSLVSLSLQTLPSWDTSDKKQIVNSLISINQLSNLKNLELFGVLPESNSLSELYHMKSLVSAKFSKYSKLETTKFYEMTGLIK